MYDGDTSEIGGKQTGHSLEKNDIVMGACGAPEPDGRARRARGQSGSAAAMSQGTAEPASETVSAEGGGGGGGRPQCLPRRGAGRREGAQAGGRR